MRPIVTPRSLSVPLSLLLLLPACGDDGGSADSVGVTGIDGGLVTEGADAADDDGDASSSGGPTGAEGSGEGESSTTAGNDDSAGSSETGDPEPDPPAECTFAACYGAGAANTTGTGVRSQVLAGCEGEAFRPSASTTVGAMGTIGGSDAARGVPVLADITGDGNLDVVLAARKLGVFVVPGDGTGDFVFDQQNVIVLVGFTTGGWGADAGDIDGNGTIDVAVGDHTWDGAAWLNSGGGSFGEGIAGFAPDGRPGYHNGTVLGDVDGDGDLDGILGGDQFSPTNTSTRLFDGAAFSAGAAPGVSGAAGYMEMHDVDNDGDLDLIAFAAAGASGLQAQIFKNNGGSWQSAGAVDGMSITSGSADPRQGGAGDLNCDGFTDIAVGGTIYFGDGSRFSAGPVLDDAAISHLGDMNGDGALDVVTLSTQGGLRMYYNDGTGQSFTREVDGLPDETYQQLGSPLVTAYGLELGDLDNNGNLDILRFGSFGSSWVLEAWSR